MMIKHWGVRPMNQQNPEDPSQQQPQQAAFAPLAEHRKPASQASGSPTTPMARFRHIEQPLLVRRRTLIRMLRVELEATLVLLGQALEQARSVPPAV
jgi:hypothetical protein